jgi:hypothetical protein
MTDNANQAGSSFAEGFLLFECGRDDPNAVVRRAADIEQSSEEPFSQCVVDDSS